MSFAVSVRDIKYWNDTLRVKGKLDLSEECRTNANVIAQIIPYAKPALPRFDASSEEIQYISESIAYLLRTDLVKTNTRLYDQMVPPRKKSPVFFGEDSKVRLMNNPNVITSDFELRNTGLSDHLMNCGAEWFRCYAATFEATRLTDKFTRLGGSFAPAFVFADVTAFLLDPTQLIDYHYSEEEMRRFNEELERDFSEI